MRRFFTAWHFHKCRSFALPNRPKYLCVPGTEKILKSGSVGDFFKSVHKK